MKIVIAGASGAIGSQLVPGLVAGGHGAAGATLSAEDTVAAVRHLENGVAR